MEILFNKTISTLSDMTEVRAKKHRVILSNVANMDTPGFKPSDLTFSSELKSAQDVRIARTNTGHLTGQKGDQGSLQYDIKESDEQVMLDTEMTNLSENQLLYSATVEILARKFRGLQTVLKESK